MLQNILLPSFCHIQKHQRRPLWMSTSHIWASAKFKHNLSTFNNIHNSAWSFHLLSGRNQLAKHVNRMRIVIHNISDNSNFQVDKDTNVWLIERGLGHECSKCQVELENLLPPRRPRPDSLGRPSRCIFSKQMNTIGNRQQACSQKLSNCDSELKKESKLINKTNNLKRWSRSL